MKGNLAQLSAFDALAEVRRRRASGTLRFQQEAITRQLFVDAGTMIRFAASNSPPESISAMFRERGGVAEAQLQEAAVAKQPQELLGTTLVRLGFIGRERLASIVEEHIRRVLKGLSTLRDGTYEFQAGALPFREQLDAGVAVAEALLEWARGVTDADWIRRRLASGEARIAVAARPPEGYQQIKLLPAEGFTMSRVDGSATVNEICLVSPMGEENTLRALFSLVLAGVLEIQGGEVPPLPPPSLAREGGAPAPRPAAAAPGKTVTPANGGGHPAGQAIASGAAVPSTAARPATAPPGAKPAPGARPAQSAGGARPPQKAAPPRKVTPIATRMRPGATPDLEQEMLQRFDAMRSQDLYQVLGVASSVSSDDVRRAYYGLAKRFHPDKFTNEEMKAKAEKVFGHITEAYSTLSRDETRQKYDQDQASRKPATHEKAADTHDLARVNFRHGRDMVEKGRLGEAVSFFQNACDQDPSKADYFYYLALTQSKNPRWKKDAEENFLKALQIDPTHANAYAELGAVYARGGVHSKARDMFRKALEWDPANRTALQGLEAEEPEKKGLLGMFKK